MNYIQQVNGFWAKAETDDLTGNDIAVYFAILKYCNSLNWLNPFICHWHIICQYSKVSKNTYYKCVDRLNQLNYIEFKKGERSKTMPKMTVLIFENNKGTIREQNGNKEGTKREQEGNLYKLLNYKTIKLIKQNLELVNSKIEHWINSEIKKEDSDVKKLTKEEVEEAFIDWFNKKRSKALNKKSNLKALSDTDKSNLHKLRKKYNGKDFDIAFNALVKSKWALDNNGIKPDHFLRNNNFNSYYVKGQDMQQDKPKSLKEIIKNQYHG